MKSGVTQLIGCYLALSAAVFASSETGMAATAAGQASTELAGAWRLVHTPNPGSGPDAVSIMHTADTTKSDLELAGLMIRCNIGRPELAIVLLRAFPLRARPVVRLGAPGHETQFEATVSPPGTAISVSGDPKAIVAGVWQSESDLSIHVIDGQTTISGVVPLTGLQSAFNVFVANCPRP
jgi:hypothetical protein